MYSLFRNTQFCFDTRILNTVRFNARSLYNWYTQFSRERKVLFVWKL